MNPSRALEIGYQLRLLFVPPNRSPTPSVCAPTAPASSSVASLPSPSSQNASTTTSSSLISTSPRTSHVFSSLLPATRAHVSKLLSPLGLGATLDDTFSARCSPAALCTSRTRAPTPAGRRRARKAALKTCVFTAL